jgi:hypothetical protein
MAFVDTKGRFDATISPAAVDELERQGKKVTFSLSIDDRGNLSPLITCDDWPTPDAAKEG